MRLQEVGAPASRDNRYLDYEWYRQLDQSQLEAYIRYLFIALNENAYDLDSPAHRNKRVKWDGGDNNYGHRHKRIWNKIAAVVKRYDAPPGTWMAAHFSPAFHAIRVAENKGFISNRPELLYSATSYDTYRHHVENFNTITIERCAAAEFSVAVQMELLRPVIKNDDDLILYIVADKTNVNATPFFRHAFAAAAGCDRAVNKYITQAAVEYDMNQQLYDALALAPENAWWISQKLKETVINSRKYWSAYRG